jgi:hypothetical protein
MKSISVLIIIMSCVMVFSQNKYGRKEEIKRTISNELNLYPEERLIDLYKSFFQGYWGPGHMITDSIAALNYLNRELEQMEKADTLLIHELGYYGRYVRVNLLFIKNGKIPVKEFADMFINSVNQKKENSIDEWMDEWSYVLSIIEEMNLSFVNFEEDKNIIDELFKQRKYVLHHSDYFVKTYFPHYRVFSIEQSERLKRYILQN